MGCDKNLGVASIGVAAVLLGLVAFDVPYFKLIYFLRVDLSGAAASTLAANQRTPFVNLGVLNYCADLQNGLGPQMLAREDRVCLEIHQRLPPLHPLQQPAHRRLVIAFAFTLLALLGIPFIAECCADFFSGFAGATGLTVFIFDLAFFFIIKKCVDAETGASSAVMGNAIWLTVIAMLLLLVTPILFLIGRCCGCAGGVGKGIYKPLK
ncbi:hypothetical protein B0H14DRAFT_3475278 [Mycena olivaceomarginata]|nr:hypothetical protein B0H14DRAFT_3475278 [Mycena olivaceomarginata]